MYITRLVQSSSDHRSSGLHLYYLLAPSWACYYHQLVETEKGLYSSLSSADVHIRNVSDSMIRKSLPHSVSGVCSGFPSRQTQGVTRISCKGAATMIISTANNPWSAVTRPVVNKTARIARQWPKLRSANPMHTGLMISTGGNGPSAKKELGDSRQRRRVVLVARRLHGGCDRVYRRYN